MLSIHPISSSPVVATRYYTKGDYYSKGDDEPSVWSGAGASILGLEGSVKPSDFQAILEGKLPRNETAGWEKTGSGEHHPGWDLTFSAPKGVSIMATVGGDQRLIEAHNDAVQDALKFMEKYAHVRERADDGTYVFKATNNLVVAQFTEFFSRTLDPHLHTHCPIANMTYDAERGEWFSLYSYPLFLMKMAGGQIYRNALAFKVQELGYDIRKTLDKGLFDLRNVPKPLLEIYSRRRKKIEDYAEKHGWKSASEFAIATLITRPAKTVTSHPEVINDLQHRAGELLPDLRQAFWNATANERGLTSDRTVADAAVKHALKHLSGKEAVIEHGDAILEALKVSVGETTWHDIEKALKRLGGLEEYLGAAFETGGRQIFHGRTTEQSIAMETKIAEQILAHRKTVRPLASKRSVQRHLDASNLTKEQRRAAAYILRTQDRTISVVGVAGAGKSHLIKTVVDATPSRNYLALAPTSTAAIDLGKSAGIPSQTLAGFLQTGGYHLNRNSILFVDESSMTGIRQSNRLLEIAEARKCRIVLVGDTKQLEAIDQGKPFSIMVKQGLRGPFIGKSFRHKNTGMEALATALRKGKTKEAFELLSHRIKQISADQLTPQIARNWLKHPNREKIQIAALDNSSRISINAAIRKGLQRERVVHRKDHKFKILSSKALSRQQMKIADYYKKGDVVVFHRGQKALGIEKDERFEILSSLKNKVLLANVDTKQRLLLEPKKSYLGGVNIYEVQKRDLAVGDKIQWRKNLADDKEVQNGHTGIIKDISQDDATIKFDHDVSRTLNLKDNPYWDLGYALTVYKQQGKSTPINWIVANTKKVAQITLTALYVSVTRAERSVQLFTEDTKRFKRSVQLNPGGKTSSFEGRGIEIDLHDPVFTKAPGPIDILLDHLPDHFRTKGHNILDQFRENRRELFGQKEEERDPRIERAAKEHEDLKTHKGDTDLSKETVKDGIEAER